MRHRLRYSIEDGDEQLANQAFDVSHSEVVQMVRKQSFGDNSNG